MDCQCGHKKSAHIYEEGPCRPGFVCLAGCKNYKTRWSKEDEAYAFGHEEGYLLAEKVAEGAAKPERRNR